MRLFGLLATGVLLGVGAAIALTVIPDSKSPSVALPEPAPAAAPKAAHKKHKPAKPKFTRAQRQARAAAVGTLRDQGYRPVTLKDYDPGHVLRVLIGKGDGGQRAFFFAGGRFIGNDAADDSDSIRVVRAGNRSVSLSYKVQGGRRARVLFRWDGKDLAPQTAIPTAAQRNTPAA
jgi:LppP/LprE lipoprotein